ncbi:MAG: transposase family protein, partial [Gaiellaceae bacterium]
NWMGDKGYIGNDMITPIRKPANRELLDWEKEFNTQINKIRYVIEQTIANFKRFLAVSSGFGDQVRVDPAWRVDEGVNVSLAA